MVRLSLLSGFSVLFIHARKIASAVDLRISMLFVSQKARASKGGDYMSATRMRRQAQREQWEAKLEVLKAKAKHASADVKYAFANALDEVEKKLGW